MSNMIVHTPDQIRAMAQGIAKSRLFGVQNEEQAFALMLIAQAEGMHPAIAARDYHIIQGRPTLKADAMLARFQQMGGVVQWEEVTDKRVAAHFHHPTASPKPVLIEWTDETVRQAQLGGNPMHKKYPRQMKRARVISEGIRTVYPAAVAGIYTPEEAMDMEPAVKQVKVVDRGPVVSDARAAPTESERKQMEDGFDRPVPDADREVIVHFQGKGKPPKKMKLADMTREQVQEAVETARYRYKNASGKYADKNKAEAEADGKMLKAWLSKMPAEATVEPKTEPAKDPAYSDKFQAAADVAGFDGPLWRGKVSDATAEVGDRISKDRIDAIMDGAGVFAPDELETLAKAGIVMEG